LLSVLCTCAQASAAGRLPAVSIAYGGWEMVPMAKSTADDVRRHPTYRIVSDNHSFYEFVSGAINEARLKPCSAPVDSWHQIRLVVDITADGKRATFVSDGAHLF